MHSRVFLPPSLSVIAGFVLIGVLGCGPDSVERDVVPQDGIDVAEAVPEAQDNRPAILFLGTSLTAGYGLADPEFAFPALIQQRIDSLDLDFRVVNGGVSGDTSAAGLERLRFLLRSPVRVLVLELGANDGLRGLDPEAMLDNLAEVIGRTRTRYPDVEIVLAGMEAPTNLGARYTDRFREVFADVAHTQETELIPFLLEGVAAVPDLNQSDFIHPTAEGHRIIAETVWTTLGPILGRL